MLGFLGFVRMRARAVVALYLSLYVLRLMEVIAGRVRALPRHLAGSTARFLFLGVAPPPNRGICGSSEDTST
jgi:hypothetical protein